MSAAAQETTLPYPTESEADFSVKVPVDDLLVGDLVYIKFDIKNSENIFAFEAEIEYDTDCFSFSEIGSDVMDISVSSEGDGSVRFAASMLGEKALEKKSLPINLILKSLKSGNGTVVMKNAILVYNDLSYTKFDNVDKSVRVNVKKASSSTSSGSGGGGGGGGGGGSAGGYYPSGNIVAQSTATPTPTDIAPVEEENEDLDESKTEFSDLGSVEWAREAIESLCEKGVLNGIGGGLFNPSGKITRAEFAKMIVLASGIDVEGAECGYSDVSKDEWYYPYISAATQKSLLNGYASGEFRPNAYITREEMAVIAMNCLSYASKNAARTIVLETAGGETVSFTDDDILDEYANTIEAAAEYGLVKGMGDGTFRPKDTLTRAQAVTVAVRLAEILK